jgi:formate--tetrahydrofolate ligase
MALLDEALLPNLVQTTEGTPALVHTGPFGNIAHGTSSVISQDMGLRLADYVVNEAGFAADLGAEKYMDIVTRVLGVSPSVAVLVTTVQSMRNQGEGNLENGFANLAQHIRSLQHFGVPLVIAVNRFPHDSDADLAQLLAYCAQQDVACAMTEPFTRGGECSIDLARKVVETIDTNADARITPAYALSDSYETKAVKVATQVYGAAGVEMSEIASEKLRQLVDWGLDGLPICIAKTQYSLSDDPKLLGAPKGWKLRITDVSLSAGAGFVVMIAGNMMLMPGLPKVPRAVEIDVNEAGEIVGV